MITLTTPVAVTSQLGGSTTIGYDKVVLDAINYSPIFKTVNAQVRLTVSSDATQPVLMGSVVINLNASTLELFVPDINFRRHITLTAGQVTTLQGYINTSQNNIEAGLVSLGVAIGAQTTGV